MGDSVVIPHIFGTVALITMFLTVGTYFNGISYNLSREAYRAQLGQVSDYLASNLIDLVVLSKLTEKELFLIKHVKVPPYIGDRLYNISIEEIPSTYMGENLLKILTDCGSLGVYSTSGLPWPKSTQIQIYESQNITTRYNGQIELHREIFSNDAERRAAQTGELATLIVWCHKFENSLTIGLGVLDINGET